MTSLGIEGAIDGLVLELTDASYGGAPGENKPLCVFRYAFVFEFASEFVREKESEGAGCEETERGAEGERWREMQGVGRRGRERDGK